MGASTITIAQTSSTITTEKVSIKISSSNLTAPTTAATIDVTTKNTTSTVIKSTTMSSSNITAPITIPMNLSATSLVDSFEYVDTPMPNLPTTSPVAASEYVDALMTTNALAKMTMAETSNVIAEATSVMPLTSTTSITSSDESSTQMTTNKTVTTITNIISDATNEVTAETLISSTTDAVTLSPRQATSKTTAEVSIEGTAKLSAMATTEFKSQATTEALNKIKNSTRTVKGSTDVTSTQASTTGADTIFETTITKIFVQWGDWNEWSGWNPTCYDDSADSIYKDSSKYYPNRSRTRECIRTENGVNITVAVNDEGENCPFEDKLERQKDKNHAMERFQSLTFYVILIHIDF